MGILHYTSIMKPEARGERYAVGEGSAIPEYLGIIHTKCYVNGTSMLDLLDF
jgi:hypothetical protein